MTPLGHTGIALLAALGLSKLVPSSEVGFVIVGTTLGGVALDFDILYRFYQKGTKVFDKTIGKHRFFPTHTPLFALLVSLILSLFNIYFGISFFLGTLVHLLLDTLFFPEGINFLFPLNKKMVTFLTIKTHKFWAPKEISQVDGWWKNYFTSPLFWLTEVAPTTLAIMLLFLSL